MKNIGPTHFKSTDIRLAESQECGPVGAYSAENYGCLHVYYLNKKYFGCSTN